MSKIIAHHSETQFFTLLTDPMILEVDMVSGQTYDLSGVIGYQYNGTIDWGNGGMAQTFESYDDPALTYVAPSTQTVQVKVYGTYESLPDTGAILNDHLIKVLSLGQLGWRSFLNAFSGNTNLSEFYSGVTNTSLVDDFSFMFNGTTGLSVYDDSSMSFSSATTLQSYMEETGLAGHLDFTGKDFSNVTELSSLIHNSDNITQLTITNQIMPGLTSIFEMANACSSLVTVNFTNITATNAAGVDCNWAFYQSEDELERNLTTVNLSGSSIKAASMMGTFASNAVETFDASVFETSDCTTFRSCMSMPFNSGNKLWTIDVDLWDIGSATDLDFIFNACRLGVSEYTDALIAWDALPSLVSGTTWGMGNSKYSASAATARQNIINTYSITINDGGQA